MEPPTFELLEALVMPVVARKGAGGHAEEGGGRRGVVIFRTIQNERTHLQTSQIAIRIVLFAVTAPKVGRLGVDLMEPAETEADGGIAGRRIAHVEELRGERIAAAEALRPIPHVQDVGLRIRELLGGNGGVVELGGNSELLTEISGPGEGARALHGRIIGLCARHQLSRRVAETTQSDITYIIGV